MRLPHLNDYKEFLDLESSWNELETDELKELGLLIGQNWLTAQIKGEGVSEYWNNFHLQIIKELRKRGKK